MATGNRSTTLWGPGESDFPSPSPEPQEVVIAFTDVGGFLWTVPSNIARGRADILIVGGGGGANRGLAGQYVAPGGGGAGRLILLEDFALTAEAEIEIVVGYGGLGARGAEYPEAGGDSAFGDILAPGGGSSGSGSGLRDATDGGSGGGTTFFGNIGLAIPGVGVAGLGNNGAGSFNTINGSRGGGGGGAAGPGELGYANRGGNGGPGIYIQWADAHGYGDNGWFAGGGGGGIYNHLQNGPIPVGGVGGGGDGGGPGQDGEDGMPGTGGGGGGAGTAISAPANSKGGDGGSGIVLIRYFELV